MEKKIEIMDEIIASMVEIPLDRDSYLRTVRQNVEKFAKCVCLGKVVCIANFEANILQPQGEKGSLDIYENAEGYDTANAYVQNYEIQGWGKMQFVVYPKKGKNFDEESKNCIKTMSNLVYSHAVKTRLYLMSQKAMNYDLMTQIPNIKSFFTCIQKNITMGKISDYNAYYFNCKNYKYINAVCGYNNGSEILKIYSRDLYNFCDDDEIVARLGGDNFTALIKKEHADKFMEILKGYTIYYPVNGEDKKVVISTVAGICEIQNARNTGEVMMPIDIAFQVARQSTHEDFVYFTGNLKEQIMKKQEIVSQLNENIKGKEFQAYYQPKVDMLSGKIYGVEALVRWFKKGKMIFPNEFIPVLESNGSIRKLDFVVLEQVCQFVSEQLKKGNNPPVISVNFSRWHLKDEDFVETVEKMVDTYGVPHEYIEIELTETADIEGYNSMSDAFSLFKKKGFQTAIDDFGTGYSSLKMLVGTDVDILKIDKAFIDEICTEGADRERKLLLNMLHTAKDLELESIAEGVETEEQRDYLIKAGCYKAQGYYYYKPMPKDQFEALL